MRVESLAIGDELLDGRVADNNTKDLGDALSVLGLELHAAGIVPDSRTRIIDAIRVAVARSDIVVTSGGLGPTSDDITGECIAEAAGVEMRFDEPSFERMSAMFSMRNIPMPESNRQQAMLPASSRTLENEMGTAPGFVTPFDVDGRRVEVWSFPGVPREYKHLRDDHLLPSILQRLAATSGAHKKLLRRTLRCLGLAESAIGERLSSFEQKHPHIRVQYRAAFPEIIVRLVQEIDDSLSEPQQQLLQAALDQHAHDARADIGDSVYAVGDAPLERRIFDVLQQQQHTLATAESCTGGLIAKRITDVEGSSAVFSGGVVSYANSVKTSLLGVPAATLTEFGAVSAETAAAMALGAQKAMATTWAVSTTGIAGPGGGSADKPVGLVWFGIAGPGIEGGVVTVKKKLPDFGRDRIREMATATAMRLLWERMI
jgi:nicotinamide-nucleotide amidase